MPEEDPSENSLLKLNGYASSAIPAVGVNNGKRRTIQSLVTRKSNRRTAGIYRPYSLSLRLLRGGDLFQGCSPAGARDCLRSIGPGNYQGRSLRKVHADGTRPADWREIQGSSPHCSDAVPVDRLSLTFGRPDLHRGDCRGCDPRPNCV